MISDTASRCAPCIGWYRDGARRGGPDAAAVDLPGPRRTRPTPTGICPPPPSCCAIVAARLDVERRARADERTLAPTLRGLLHRAAARPAPGQRRTPWPPTATRSGCCSRFAQRRTGKPPPKLALEDLDAELIGAFLDHLEAERHNSVPTRNARLAAMHSLFAYAALRHPEHAALIQRVLAIPTKRTDRQLVSFLTAEEVDALLAAPDRRTWVGTARPCAAPRGCPDRPAGQRAHRPGLRRRRARDRRPPSLPRQGPQGAHHAADHPGRAVFYGFGWRNVEEHRAIRSSRADEAGHSAGTPLRSPCPDTSHGRGAALPVAGTQGRCTPCPAAHAAPCPYSRPGSTPPSSLSGSVTRACETTQIYLHADLAIKERALARTAPADTKPGRYRPPDALLAFLEAL